MAGRIFIFIEVDAKFSRRRYQSQKLFSTLFKVHRKKHFKSGTSSSLVQLLVAFQISDANFLYDSKVLPDMYTHVNVWKAALSMSVLPSVHFVTYLICFRKPVFVDS